MRRKRYRVPPYAGYLPTMLTASSGISVRFGLRNLQNMLLSPILGKYDVNSEFLSPKKIKVSDLAKAFFFGDTDTIRQDCFENLYQANNQSRTDFILIKSRILDFIYRICNLTSPITEVFDFALMFNYDETVVISTLNEMLRRSRPLLWSEDGFKIENPKSKARIMVTPIGKGYYERFFGEYFYDEVCIAAGPKTNVTPRAVYDFHTKLTDQIVFDPKREEWLRAQIVARVGDKWSEPI